MKPNRSLKKIGRHGNYGRRGLCTWSHIRTTSFQSGPDFRLYAGILFIFLSAARARLRSSLHRLHVAGHCGSSGFFRIPLRYRCLCRADGGLSGRISLSLYPRPLAINRYPERRLLHAAAMTVSTVLQ